MHMQPGWSPESQATRYLSEPSTLFIEIRLIQHVVLPRLKQQASKHGSLLLDVEAETSSMRRASAALTRRAEDDGARLAAAAAACTRVGAAVTARESALAAAVERFAVLQLLHDSGERCLKEVKSRAAHAAGTRVRAHSAVHRLPPQHDAEQCSMFCSRP